MALRALTEAELGSLARAGDVQALADLLERCRPSLYGTAIRLLGNRADAHDAVQDTFVTALLHVESLRDPGAARAWLQAVIRNVCLMRLRRRRELPFAAVEPPDTAPDPEAALDTHPLRDEVWQALGTLPADEQVTVLLRYFSRCESYDAIARVTDVPVGTVRSRLNRARTRLADTLARASSQPLSGRSGIEAGRREQWEGFYRAVHERPTPGTYRDLYVDDVDVCDRSGLWHGVETWSAHEREAIALGVRATVVDVLAGQDVTVVEVDFANPPESAGHCPPQATFVHRLDQGRSRRLRIHYPIEGAAGGRYAQPMSV